MVSSSSLHIAQNAMAKKKTNEAGILLSLKLPTGLTREEVWRAYKEACREEEREVGSADFAGMMLPVSRLVLPECAPIIDNVWVALYESGSIRPLIVRTEGCARGTVNCYRLLNVLQVMVRMEGEVFPSGTTLTGLCDAMGLDRRYYQGRTSYRLEEDIVRRVRQVVKKMLRRGQISVE